MNAATTLFLPDLPLQLFKVDTKSVKAGHVLPTKAKKWEGVYVPALQIIIAADPVKGFYGPWPDAMRVASEQSICGLPPREGAPSLSRLEVQLMIDDNLWSPVIDKTFFRFGSNYWEWTSTKCAPLSREEYAWAVHFGGGFSGRGRQSGRCHARGVAPSQYLDLGKAA
jgi:hypothetical protein